MKLNKRSEKQSVNIWKQRLTRRAIDHGVKTVPQIDFNAWSVFRHSQLTLGSSNIHPDRLVERGTIDQLIRSKQVSKNVLGTVTSVWIEDDYVRAATIPYTLAPSAYDVGSAEIANYRFFKREYADLLDAGVLVDQDYSIYVLPDQTFYNVDRLIEFCEVLQWLKNYPLADEDEWSTVESERQQATIESEVTSFTRALDMGDDFSDILDGFMGDNSKEYMITHMRDLINEHNIEFGDDSTYLDVEKLAKLSPLYQAGSKEINALYEIREVLQTSELTGLTLDQCGIHSLSNLVYELIP